MKHAQNPVVCLHVHGGVAVEKGDMVDSSPTKYLKEQQLAPAPASHPRGQSRSHESQLLANNTIS